MPRGGARPGSGRKKGSLGRAPKQVQARALQELPDSVRGLGQIFNYFMGEAAREQQQPKPRHNVIAAMLKEARVTAEKIAPYQYPRLSSVKIGGDAENPLRTVVEYDLTKMSEEQLGLFGSLLAAAISGPPEAQGERNPGNGTTAH